MSEEVLIDKLASSQISAEDAVKQIENNFDLLTPVFEGVLSDKARVKFGCAKILFIMSKKHPKKLYTKIDFFIELLDHENNIIKWNAIDILANLTVVDKKEKFEDIFSKYYDLIDDDAMVTVAHVVENSGVIAKAKPSLTKPITDNLLKIEKLKVKPKLTSECKNILYGKTINAFDSYYDQIENKKEVLSFVKRQLKSTRLSTKVKAEKFLKKYD